jgi:tetratricopeptide (TPR) repeat protein
MEMYVPQDENRFERDFYERLLKLMPQSKEVLTELAAWYTDNNEFERGLELDLKLSRLYPDDPYVWYNLACSHSLCGKAEAACDCLTQAVIRGYDEMDRLMEDGDLSFARESAAFTRFLDKADSLFGIGEEHER